VDARPLSALTAVGASAHHLFERRAGLGLPLQPWLGRRASDIIWGLALPAWALLSLTGSRRAPLLAAANGAAVATVVVHFAQWPWRRQGALPLLTAAEGLPECALGPYNFILLAWSATAITALACETRRGERVAALGGLATFWPARALARHHYRWLGSTRPQAACGIQLLGILGLSVTAGDVVLSFKVQMVRWSNEFDDGRGAKRELAARSGRLSWRQGLAAT
jgi:hypothetical protein